MDSIRNNWTKQEVEKIYHQPLLELIYQAAGIHRTYHNSREVQMCTLLSIKTGGCPENCAYCPQSVYASTGVKAERIMNVVDVLESAREAKEAGSTRFCMGAAWRQVRDSADFDKVLEMVKGVNKIGMEVCVTLGMLTEDQARRLKEAGLYAYNHNLDTSREHYSSIITTRTYDDRLETLENVRNAGISVCCGGIVGFPDETEEDHISFLHTLATLPSHPESVPINALVSVKGTRLENVSRISIWDMVRMIASARILMPKAMVRLSAGRLEMSDVEQAFCFMAGANSIFTGEKLLTTPNPSFDHDKELLHTLGLEPRPSNLSSEPSEGCVLPTHIPSSS